ncbi:MAG: OmpA family protein [Nitrosomonas sp.]|nr:OmpA family protein [Nitrosomonas sp.]MDP1951093.1 OmpA family protein [Nitrosomonas sp.]
MQKNWYFSMILVAAAIVSGCSAIPQNSSLAEAHNNYNSARSNPQVTNMAAQELKEAGDFLNKADVALSSGESDTTVNHLAYMANQQVAIAQETTKRKIAELVVANAGGERDQTLLKARTAEADEFKKQAALDQALIAQQEMQLKELNAKKTERGLVITLGDVLFRTDMAQLEPNGMRNVQKLADFLRQYPQRKVLIEGHTDSTGSSNYNQELSDRRANAVRMALIDRGISSDRIALRGYGEAYPVASNDSAATRQLNRRVEIIFSDDNGNLVPR